MDINYDFSSVTGDLGIDTVSADQNVSAYLTILVAYQDLNVSIQADGVLGFGCSPSGFVGSLKSEGKIQSSVFSLYLNNNDFSDDNNPTPDSALIIGGYDKEFALTKTSQSTALAVNNTRGY
jgi:Eukaryotic aspartyl protease